MKSALIVILLGAASPVAALCAAGRPLMMMRASTRAPAPQLVLGRMRDFVSNRVTNPFRRDNDAEKDVLTGESLVADSKKLEVPAPVAGLDQKSLSAVDSMLVRFGLKTEDEYVTCHPLGRRLYADREKTLP